MSDTSDPCRPQQQPADFSNDAVRAGGAGQGTVATVREMLAEAEREGLGRRGYFYRGVGPCAH